MKGIAQLASRVCLLQPIEAAEAACEPRIEPANAPAIEKTELVSAAIDSPEGAMVSKDTVLTIDVEYSVAGFAPKLFRLDPSFRIGVSRFAGLHEPTCQAFNAGLQPANDRTQQMIDAHLETLRPWPEKR